MRVGLLAVALLSTGCTTTQGLTRGERVVAGYDEASVGAAAATLGVSVVGVAVAVSSMHVASTAATGTYATRTTEAVLLGGPVAAIGAGAVAGGVFLWLDGRESITEAINEQEAVAARLAKEAVDAAIEREAEAPVSAAHRRRGRDTWEQPVSTEARR